jgi:hypothetical protein
MATAEIYDPATGTFGETAQMSVPRENHTATPLPDGRVFIAAGENSAVDLSSAEIYDPSSGTFTTAGMMPFACDSQTATLVAGKVLIAGGRAGNPLPTAILFDPTTGAFQGIDSR